jgi:hypothetical protein
VAAKNKPHDVLDVFHVAMVEIVAAVIKVEA